MANKSLFSWYGQINEAGGTAIRMEPRLALAQLASTSCLNNTLYCSDKQQLGDVIKYANMVSSEFAAKTAIFAREKHHMKDVPALLVAILAAGRESKLLRQVFPRVIDNGDMLRNFFEIIRSGQVGRCSFGTLPRRLIRDWFNCHTPTELFEMSVGTPSMRDILRCIHPRPLDRTRSAMYAWFVGKPYDFSLLPQKVQCFENYKKGMDSDLPHVPFEMLTSSPLSADNWTTIAKRAGWKWLIKNLNNMNKYGLFNDPEMIDFVASRLVDRNSIKKARAFPYQILSAYQFAKEMPDLIIKALCDAVEIATENVSVLPDNKSGNPSVYLFVDVSKSMTYPITGSRYAICNRANSSMLCADVAALMACCILRRNKSAQVMLFNSHVVPSVIDSNVSILENATRIKNIATGATACSAPLKQLNEENRHGDLIIVFSDNQSWKESMNIDQYGHRILGKTALQSEWEKWKVRNPQAKMVCIDVAPYTTTQVQERSDVFNCGGFGDVVFSLVDQFAKGEMSPDHLIGIIESVDLNGSSLNMEEL